MNFQRGWCGKPRKIKSSSISMPWLDISKLEVARTQLETAVDLFFKDADPAPLHTFPPSPPYPF